MALPVTWLLLHTPVTANQVTGFSLLVALAGILFFAFPSSAAFLTGAVLLQLWYLLDHVDGQIARYRKAASLTGRFFDYLMHHVTHSVIFFSLGFYVYRLTGSLFWLLWGFVTSVGMTTFNLIYDTKYKTFMERLSALRLFRVKGPEAAGPVPHPQNQKTLRKIFSLLHKSIEIHVLMNTLTLSAILETFLEFPVDLRGVLVVFYGLVIPFVTIAKVGYFIMNRKIDEEFNRTFQEVETQT